MVDHKPTPFMSLVILMREITSANAWGFPPYSLLYSLSISFLPEAPGETLTAFFSISHKTNLFRPWRLNLAFQKKKKNQTYRKVEMYSSMDIHTALIFYLSIIIHSSYFVPIHSKVCCKYFTFKYLSMLEFLWKEWC